MNGIELLNKFQQQLKEVLGKVSGLELVQIEDEPRFDQEKEIDLLIRLEAPAGETIELLVEAKATAYPRTVRVAIANIKAILSNNEQQYGLLTAPYLSADSRKLCRDEGINYLDLAGNCWLSFGTVYIEIDGKPNPYPDRRPLRSVFSPKSTRLLRVLLEKPEKQWYVKDLAKEANLSLGQTFNLKKQLLQEDYLKTTDDRKLVLSRPGDLLNAWAKEYKYTDNTVKKYYAMQEIPKIEEDIKNYCTRWQRKYAFTMHSGAARFAQFVRYKQVSVFVESDIDELQDALNLKPVDSGANVLLLTPYDDGVFYFTQKKDDTTIVSDIQLYLDLIGYAQRGAEAAEYILMNRLSKRW